MDRAQIYNLCVYKYIDSHIAIAKRDETMQSHEFAPPAKFIPRSRRCESAETTAAEHSPETTAALENSAQHLPPPSCLDRSHYNRQVGVIIHEELESAGSPRDFLISDWDFISSWDLEEPLFSATFEE
jgi:hypothetical protein